MLSYWGGEC